MCSAAFFMFSKKIQGIFKAIFIPHLIIHATFLIVFYIFELHIIFYNSIIFHSQSPEKGDSLK